METIYVEKKIGELERFPSEIRRQLLHILLAHHGEYGYGSPRRPKGYAPSTSAHRASE